VDVAGGVLADHPADAVDLDPLPAGMAAQLDIQRLLHPLLADAEAGIEQQPVRLAVWTLLACHVLSRDPGHIADDVGEGAAEGVDPRLVHIGGNTRQLGRTHIDAGELVPAQVVGEGDGRRLRGVGDLLQQARLLGVRDRDQLGDLIQRAFHVLCLAFAEQDAEVGAVGGDLHPVAVQNPAARRRAQAEVELVGVGEELVARPLHHLQIGQPSG
jgi:hypothetical protein